MSPAGGATAVAPRLRRTEGHFEAADGRRLFGRVWEPREAQRQLVLVHGYAEHSGRYDAVACWFAAHGADVVGYDHQGHGRSEGIRCHVARFDHFLDDLDRVIAQQRERRGDLPLYVVAHSMGGLIACAWARERKPDVDGLIVSSPPLAPPPGMSGLRATALRALRWITPKGKVQSDLDASGLSRDPEVVKAYLDDPLVYRHMTLSLGAEMLGAIERTAAGPGDVRLPTLMLHGDADPICSPDASAAFARGVSDCSYRVYPGLRHEIFNEPEQEAVFQDIQTWIEAQEAGSR